METTGKTPNQPPLSSKDEERIEAFLRQLAVALQRILAEEKTHQEEKKQKKEVPHHASDHS